MSRRTCESNRAIVKAWQNEKELVKVGKGTRDWSPQQQRDIIERGKAYDGNGKAFEGHHMKNVEKFPGFQGDSENIQFLSRTEHLDAHGGCFQNPTNGYYDPVYKVTNEFTDDSFKPCKSSNLTNPVMSLTKKSKSLHPQTSKKILDKQIKYKVKNKKKNNGFMKNVRKVGDFYNKNKEIINPIVLDVIQEVGYVLITNSINKHINKKATHNRSNTAKISAIIKETDMIKSQRKSPIEHMVNSYKRRRKGTLEDVRGYSRGGNKKT